FFPFDYCSSFCRECQGASNSVNISNIAQSLLKLFGMALKKVIMSKAQLPSVVSRCMAAYERRQTVIVAPGMADRIGG
ncbi:hypothetical protein, partial [Thiolapillus sp.]